MKTIRDLGLFISSGNHLLVTFGPAISKFDEIYPEPGMRAKIVGCELSEDDVRLHFYFDDFKAHNTPLESEIWADENGDFSLTAQASGNYIATEEIWFDNEKLLDGLMFVEKDSILLMFNRYLAEKSKLSYLQWLEAKVLPT